jgi:prephenate dehydratase
MWIWITTAVFVCLYANNPTTGVRVFTTFDIQELNMSTNLNSVLKQGTKISDGFYVDVHSFLWAYQARRTKNTREIQMKTLKVQ